MMSEESQPETSESSDENQSVEAPEKKAEEQASAESTTPAPESSTAPPEDPAPSAAPEEVKEEPASESSEAPVPNEKKVQLNPNLGSGSAKAVPSLGPGSGQEAVPDAREKPFPDSEKKGSVEIPKGEDLDAELEAEIEAALASGELDPIGSSTPATSAEETESTETNEVKATNEEELEAGQRLTGKIQSINNDDVFLDVGFRSSALVSRRQFTAGKDPLVGQQIVVLFDRYNPEEGLIYANLPHGLRKSVANWDAVQKGAVVDCMVVSTNKGGLSVNVGNLKGFLPASQVELGYVSDLEPYVGQKLRCQVTDVNPKKRNLVVSRRSVLSMERKELESELWKTLTKGQKLKGKVKTLVPYGAFVDIGGADGFIHVSELSWNRIKHPSEVLKEGQEVDVVITSLEADKKKIGLGYKELTQDPWARANETYEVGSTVSGKVTRITDFGAFVELEPGVEGLIHISELDYQRVKRVADVLSEGQSVEAQVLDVDLSKRRISLSLKALKEKPETEKSDEELAPGGDKEYVRKRKGPLKGGTGSSGSGGLFGDPSQFSG